MAHFIPAEARFGDGYQSMFDVSNKQTSKLTKNSNIPLEKDSGWRESVNNRCRESYRAKHRSQHRLA